jgi:hypothetical protein
MSSIILLNKLPDFIHCILHFNGRNIVPGSAKTAQEADITGIWIAGSIVSKFSCPSQKIQTQANCEPSSSVPAKS